MANTTPDARRTFLLPYISESDAVGKLTNIPGIVEADATKPIRESGVFKARANGFKTGFFDIVELRIAMKPTRQRTQNKRPVGLSAELRDHAPHALHQGSISCLRLFLAPHVVRFKLMNTSTQPK